MLWSRVVENGEWCRRAGGDVVRLIGLRTPINYPISTLLTQSVRPRYRCRWRVVYGDEAWVSSCF